MSAWFAANKLYVYLALGVALSAAGWFWVHHLERVGVAKQQALDTRAQIAQTAKVATVEAHAQAQESVAGSQLAVALAAPVVPAFVLRVCPSPPNSRGLLPADGGAGPIGADSARLSSGVAGQNAAAGPDIVPDTEALLQRANAQVTFWLAYYESCRAAGQ